MKEEHILEIDNRTFKVTIQTPKKYQNRIVKYGWVLSFQSRTEAGTKVAGDKGERFYKIAKRRFGPNRFGYSCDCDDNFWRGRLCKHVAAFKIAEGAK